EGRARFTIEDGSFNVEGIAPGVIRLFAFIDFQLHAALLENIVRLGCATHRAGLVQEQVKWLLTSEVEMDIGQADRHFYFGFYFLPLEAAQGEVAPSLLQVAGEGGGQVNPAR